MSGESIPLTERQNTSQRNVSSPFSLAVPPPSQRRSTYHRADTPTQYLDPPPESLEKKGTPYLEIPSSTIVITERPGASPRTGRLGTTTWEPDDPYEKERRKKPKKKMNDRLLAALVTFSLVVLLAIGIPLGVILPQRYVKPLPMNVLVPFYMSPIGDSWKRLEDAIVRYHDIQFTVVVNPSNGPGNTTWPSAEFINAVSRINIYPNVRTIGYIDTSNGNIPNATIRAQIATYAAWSNVSKTLSLHGIYFDQTPWTTDANNPMAKTYLQNITATARSTPGWSQDGIPLIVHNPPRLPEATMLESPPDILVVFQGAYRDMPSRRALSAALQGAWGTRENYAMLVNSTPRTLGRTGLRRTVENVRRDVEWLFLTDWTEHVYEGYGSFWDEWLDVLW